MGKVTAPKGFNPERKNRWFLVANRAEACLYEGRLGQDFRFVKRLKNPKGRLTEIELGDDSAPGRTFSSSSGKAGYTRHSFEPHSLKHETVAEDFARTIARTLAKDRSDEAFTELVVVAEPHFLGLLRTAFPEAVSGVIVKDLPREWHEGSDAELEEYLREKLS
jgi:protein required for attachment to host cells